MDRGAVSVGAVGPPFGRQFDAVAFDDVVHVLDGRESSCHFHAVVMPTQQVIIAEVELLNRGVTRDFGWKTCLQSEPSVSTVLDGGELADRNALRCKQKRRGEVGPQRVAVEVRAVQRIPRRRELVATEVRSGVAPLGNDSAVEVLDRDTLGSEVGLLVIAAEWLYRCPLVVQRHCHLPRLRILRLTLDGPQLPSGDGGCANPAELPPIVKSPMGGEYCVEQLSHRNVRPSSTTAPSIRARAVPMARYDLVTPTVAGGLAAHHRPRIDV